MSIRIILEFMIKFILPIAIFIAVVFGISYFWTSSTTQQRKKIAVGLLTAIFFSISVTIYLIID